MAVDRPLGHAGRPRAEQQVARVARPGRGRARVGCASLVEVSRPRRWRALGHRGVVGHDEGRAEAGHRRPQPLCGVRGAREGGDASDAGDGEEEGHPLRAVPQGQDDDVAPPDTPLSQPRGQRARARGQFAQTPLAAGEPQRGPRAVPRQRVVKERRRQVAPRCRWVHVAPGSSTDTRSVTGGPVVARPGAGGARCGKLRDPHSPGTDPQSSTLLGGRPAAVGRGTMKKVHTARPCARSAPPRPGGRPPSP